jgi:hypothetical protein
MRVNLRRKFYPFADEFLFTVVTLLCMFQCKQRECDNRDKFTPVLFPGHITVFLKCTAA